MLNSSLANFNILKIVSAGNSVYALDSNGDLHVWGDNAHHQLGFSSEESVVTKPAEIPNFKASISKFLRLGPWPPRRVTEN
ncbi:MAG: hypothetical protein LBP35_03365 [Candidatus Ancillula trichonymphae]|nr:hypothetical protein [Candidatus Ancillula trichonymphae]